MSNGSDRGYWFIDEPVADRGSGPNSMSTLLECAVTALQKVARKESQSALSNRQILSKWLESWEAARFSAFPNLRHSVKGFYFFRACSRLLAESVAGEVCS